MSPNETAVGRFPVLELLIERCWAFLLLLWRNKVSTTLTRHFAPVVAAMLLLAACGGDGTGPGRAPAELEVLSGHGQSGVAAGELPTPLVVRVVDSRGRPVAGVAIVWETTSGSLSASSLSTELDGTTTVRWTLGTRVGQATATATAEGLTPATFTTEVRAGPAARVLKTRGDSQAAPVGTTLGDTLIVRVTDIHDNPIAGVPVSWNVSAGGGTVAPVSGETDSGGHARARWTLGNSTGERTVTVTAGALSPVVFTSTTTAGAASVLEKVSGDGQSSTVATQLSQRLVVKLSDASGNPVVGGQVAWSVAAGGGSITPLLSTTDAEGMASARWTLGTGLNVQTAVASAIGQTVSFSGTATAGPPTRLVKVGGDGLSARVRNALSDSLAVVVVDTFGNPVAGVRVNWAATGGGGTVSPTGVDSNIQGIARTQWTLGPTAGPQSATAAAVGVATAAFVATATSGVPVSLQKLSGDAQADTVARVLPDSLAVLVLDGDGNPIPEATVQWTVIKGGGTITPTSSISDSAGVARARRTLGTIAGEQTVSASIPGFAATFSANALPGRPASVQVAPGGLSLGLGRAEQLLAIVRDQYDNAVPDHVADWTTTAAGVVSVDGSGVVQGVSLGDATITATAVGASDAIVVTVAQGAENWLIDHRPVTTEIVRSVWGSDGSNAFAVGEGGFILRYNGSSWAPMTSPVQSALYGIAGTGASNIYAVGAAGTVLRYNGITWSSIRSNVAFPALNQVWAFGGVGYAVGDAGSIVSLAGSAWEDMTSGTSQQLFGVWGSGAANVYAVGAGGTVLRFDGTQWNVLTGIPTSRTLRSVWGSSAGNIVAVGEGGTIIRFDGTNWLPMTSGTTKNLHSVWGTSSTNVYAVGEDGLVLRYNGTSWSVVPSQTSGAFHAVWGSSTTNVFMVGERGAIHRYTNTTAWDVQNEAQSMQHVWGADADNIFAVGLEGVVMWYNGTRWARLPRPDSRDLYGVWGTAANNVFVVGASGAIFRWNGTAWQSFAGGTTQTLRAVWGVSPTRAYAVGEGGTILRWNGTSWQTMTSGTTVTLRSVWGTSGDDVFAAGADGVVRRLVEDSWLDASSGTSAGLTGVWAARMNLVYVVGAGGTIRRQNGTAWQSMSSGTTQPLNGIWGTSSGNVYAVGAGGALIRYNGTSWSPMTSPTSESLNAVWGSSVGNLYAVGTNVILRAVP